MSEASWYNLAPASSPTNSRASMVYHSGQNKLILYGGEIAAVPNRQTWEFDGTNWTNLAPTFSLVSYPDRSGFAMAYDSVADRIIAHGGRIPSGGTNTSQATLSYNYGTNTWTQLNPATIPGERWNHNMVYDINLDFTFMFGGSTLYNAPASVVDTTWRWNGTDWTQLFPASAPSPRMNHAMCYWPQQNKTILYGGINNVTNYYDTWSFDGTDWTQLSAGPGPAFDNPRTQMTVDPLTGKVILYGIFEISPGVYQGQLWEWNDGLATWYQVNTNTAPIMPTTPILAPYSPLTGAVLYGAIAGPTYQTWKTILSDGTACMVGFIF